MYFVESLYFLCIVMCPWQLLLKTQWFFLKELSLLSEGRSPLKIQNTVFINLIYNKMSWSYFLFLSQCILHSFCWKLTVTCTIGPFLTRTTRPTSTRTPRRSPTTRSARVRPSAGRPTTAATTRCPRAPTPSSFSTDASDCLRQSLPRVVVHSLIS